MARSKASVLKSGKGKIILPERKQPSVMAKLLEGRRRGRFRGLIAAGRRIRRVIKRSSSGVLCYSRAGIERLMRQALNSELICPYTYKIVLRLGRGVVDYVRQELESDILRDNAAAQRLMLNSKRVTLMAKDLQNSRDIAAIYNPNAFRVDPSDIAKEFGLTAQKLVVTTVESIPHCVDAMKTEEQKKREASEKRRRRKQQQQQHQE